MFTTENLMNGLLVLVIVIALAIITIFGIVIFARGDPFKPLKKARNRFWGKSPDK